ncbi:MAG: hypothetical protein ACLT4I_11460 [Megamonas funiformis]
MNDATAMKSSDIAISVDNAVNIAKESANSFRKRFNGFRTRYN